MRGDLFKLNNEHGMTIKGLTFGAPRPGGVGVLYLPGIVLGMTAVHRMGLELAHALADSAIASCLFDPTGIGESEGNFPGGSHANVAAWVEAGHLVGDTLAVIDFFVSHAGLDRVVLVGHCGGALTASYAAAVHPAVAGALLICPPALGHTGAASKPMSEGAAIEYGRQYLHKLGSPGAWLRLLRGESSYRTLYRTAIRLITRRARRAFARLRPAPPPPAHTSAPGNPRLAAALHAVRTARKPIAVVFGDRDSELEPFRAFHRDHAPPGIPITVLPDTSHGFVTEDSMALLTAEIRSFVAEIARAPRESARRSRTMVGL